MHCPLCNYTFDDRNACAGCGFTKHCTMIKCPNCQYEFVEKSQVVGWISKIFDKIKKKKEVKVIE